MANKIIKFEIDEEMWTDMKNIHDIDVIEMLKEHFLAFRKEWSLNENILLSNHEFCRLDFSLEPYVFPSSDGKTTELGFLVHKNVVSR